MKDVFNQSMLWHLLQSMKLFWHSLSISVHCLILCLKPPPGLKEEPNSPVSANHIGYSTSILYHIWSVKFHILQDIIYDFVCVGGGTHPDGFLKRNSLGRRAWNRNWQPLQRDWACGPKQTCQTNSSLEYQTESWRADSSTQGSVTCN